jgi:hypothetical protein
MHLTGAGTAILTFKGGFHPQTQSLWLTDAHHHLAIAVYSLLLVTCIVQILVWSQYERNS